MEVVINACYGGFSLSPLAVKEFASLEGKECYFFDATLQGDYKPLSIEEASKAYIVTSFSVPNPNEVLMDNKEWGNMTDAEKKKSKEIYDSIEIDDRGIARDNASLISVVKKLGEKANGRCAKLKIVNIPDGTDYTVQEYDGSEWIAETHQTWS